MTANLSDFTTLTFDCYGTLIDWESGIWDALQPLITASGRDDVDRQAGLEAFAEVESAQQAQTPDLIYPEVLTRVHRSLAERFDMKTNPGLDRDFGQSVPRWPAFPDTADALRALSKRYKLVILSNVDRAGFAASNSKLGVAFDAIYTAEDVGSYKPDPRNFEYLLEHLRTDLQVEAPQVLHTAQSLFHDHVQARSFGLACAWVDRQGLAGGERWGATAKVTNRPEVDFLVPTLEALADQAGL